MLTSFRGNAQTAQDTTKLYRIETNDGNEYVGRIIFKSSEIVRLKTEKLGELTINQKDISKIVLISKERVEGGAMSYSNLHASRYFCSSNGYGIGKGNGYYQNMWIFYNQVGYGITNNISIGVGIVPLFLFAGANSPAWITPKLTFPIVKDRVNVGVGILAATVLGANTETTGFAYGVSTFGTVNNNVSIGIAYGYYGSSWADRPVIALNGKVRVGKKSYLMSENYYIGVSSEDYVVLSLFGGRSLIRKVALDYGLVFPVYKDMSNFFAIPWLGITIPFGSN